MPALDVRILRMPLDAPAWHGGGDANSSQADHPDPAPAAIDGAHITPIVAGATATTLVPLPADPLAELLDRDVRGLTDANPILRARCDDVARRIVRDGGQISLAALSREIGSAPATIKRLMGSPLFRRIYSDVSDELMGTIDDRIADERLDTIVRQDSLQKRAMTVLADCFEIARKHKVAVENGATPRPGLLKVAVDAAAEVRQIGLAARAGSAPGNGTQVNINITRNQATVIQGAIRESGIDLSDVLDGVFAVPSAPEGA